MALIDTCSCDFGYPESCSEHNRLTPEPPAPDRRDTQCPGCHQPFAVQCAGCHAVDGFLRERELLDAAHLDQDEACRWIELLRDAGYYVEPIDTPRALLEDRDATIAKLRAEAEARIAANDEIDRVWQAGIAKRDREIAELRVELDTARAERLAAEQIAARAMCAEREAVAKVEGLRVLATEYRAADARFNRNPDSGDFDARSVERDILNAVLALFPKES